jgi:hypothetical protein
MQEAVAGEVQFPSVCAGYEVAQVYDHVQAYGRVQMQVLACLYCCLRRG